MRCTSVSNTTLWSHGACSGTTRRSRAWNGKPLNDFLTTVWASMRSSWTDNSALYVAVKAGMNLGPPACTVPWMR
ncbi:hypothetical protein C8J57DRAFT_1287782, partial [Mycena rebaudengoi]